VGDLFPLDLLSALRQNASSSWAADVANVAVARVKRVMGITEEIGASEVRAHKARARGTRGYVGIRPCCALRAPQAVDEPSRFVTG
jgi:hypothetical protein